METVHLPTPDIDETQWPAVIRAYDYVLPSYQLLAARFESSDTRLTVVLNFVSSISLGVPLLARAIDSNVPFRSRWFVAAMALFVIASIVGLAGRTYGRLTLPDPMMVFEKHLASSEWQFKKDMLYFAGQHFERNREAVRRKGNLSLAVAALLVLEILCLVIWIAR